MATAHKDRHKSIHHLSARNHDGTGWIESISNLTEENPATALLAETIGATVKVNNECLGVSVRSGQGYTDLICLSSRRCGADGQSICSVDASSHEGGGCRWMKMEERAHWRLSKPR